MHVVPLPTQDSVTPHGQGTYDVNFGRGGFQGAEGALQGQEFYIENVFEELDSENEVRQPVYVISLAF